MDSVQFLGCCILNQKGPSNLISLYLELNLIFQTSSKKPNENGHEKHSNSSGNTSNGRDDKVTNAATKVLETSTATTSAVVPSSSSSSVSDLKSVSVTMTSTPVPNAGSNSSGGNGNNSSSATDLSTKSSKNSSAYDFNASDSFGPSEKTIPPMRKDSPAKVRYFDTFLEEI